MKQITLTAILALAATLAQAPAQAQQQGSADKPATAAQPYAPGLGEIMSLQQMRHSKLWFAGRSGNWDLANYEVDELKEGFEDVETMFPTKDGVALKPVVEAITSNELADLGKAVEAKDRTKFARAFDKLSAACNACHQTTKHGFIVIRSPTALPYTNQSFAPAREGRSRH